jgi:hypothetical protein
MKSTRPDIIPTKPDDYLDAEATSQIIDVDIRTLERWRQLRIGPTYLRLSKRCIRYRRADLEAWLEDHKVTCAG